MGLYDPAFEHDGCGVACLARLDGQPAHETISRAIETLDNLEHRGAEGADAETGDGAGILVQIPDAFLRAELDFALPAAGALRGRGLHAPARGRPAVGGRDRDRAAGRGRRTAGPGLARRAGRRARARPGRAGGDAGHPPAADRLHEADQDAFERRLYGIRRRAERGLGDAVAFPSFSSRTMVLKGMLRRAAAAALLQGPVRPALRERAGDRPLALLDQHVPELGARAPVPLHRPQRRDQHAARQRQLDAGARARAGRVRRGAAGDPAGRVGLRVASTPCSSCSCWRAGRSRTR